jgi:hypothetical protein
VAAEPITTNLAFTGAEQSYVVPDRVHLVDVVLNGAAGGSTVDSTATGGIGAKVVSTLEVSPGDVLYVEVGGQGGPGNSSAPGAHAGGYNGGGAGDTGFGNNDGLGGAGGGGATDIRYCSITSVSCETAVDSISSRVLVAGGGGGSGDVGRIGATTRVDGGNGGAAGQPGTVGSNAAPNGQTEHGGNFGTGATSGHAGTGGAAQPADSGDLVKIEGAAGGDGDATGRGNGGLAGALDNGGGGGGGFRSGGAGGGGSSDNVSVHGAGGGGGGGASVAPVGTITAATVGGDGSATITTVPTPAPVAVLGAATATGSSIVAVSGTLNPLGYPVSSCAFGYGLTSKLGASVACTPSASSISNSTNATPVSAVIAGLEPGTKYFVALVADGDGGLGVSQELTVTTKVAKPTVAKPKASSIKPTSARLSASVYPGGGATTVVFNYGTTKHYGKHSKTVTIKAGKTVASSIGTIITKLKAHKKYYARATVRNSAGTVKSANFTFTTKKKAKKKK